MFKKKKKLFSEKYLKPYFLQKKVTLIFVTRRTLRLKITMSTRRWFSTIFSENAAFLKLRLNIRSLPAPSDATFGESPHPAASQRLPTLSVC